jgi:hypothetical protein
MADLEHVAFGVSVEDRRYGLPRIRSLQGTPARLRFLSVEPPTRRPRASRPAQDRLGHRRRRERPARPSDASRVGRQHPSSMPRAAGAFLLQAVGSAHASTKPDGRSTAAPTMSFRSPSIAFSQRAMHDPALGPESHVLGAVRAVSARQARTDSLFLRPSRSRSPSCRFSLAGTPLLPSPISCTKRSTWRITSLTMPGGGEN